MAQQPNAQGIGRQQFPGKECFSVNGVYIEVTGADRLGNFGVLGSPAALEP